MRKMLRKFVSLTLVLAMVLGGAAFAFADSTNDAVSATAKEPTVKDGYNVMIDGGYVSFTDAVPQNISGRIMVPFRAIFEAMGAKVDYDNATKTVTADKDDIHISFVIGSKEITVKKGSDVSTKTMDVAAFIEAKTSRTFVPTRFVAEALGYTVGWDNTAKTAVVVDTESIFANAANDFSIISKALTGTETDANATYRSTGDLAMNFAMNGLTEADNFDLSVEASLDGLTKGLDGEMSMAASFDFGDLYKDADADEAAMVEALKNITIDVKMDAESGDIWFKCPALNAFAGVSGDNVWFKMNMYDLYESMGIDLKPLLSGAESGSVEVSDLLETLVSEDSLDVDSYDSISSLYVLAKAIAGDEAFKTTKSGSTTTYTVAANKDSVMKVLTEKFGMSSVEAALLLLDSGLTDFNLNISVKEKASKVSELSIKGNMNAEDGTVISLELYGDDTKSKVALSFAMPSVMKMSVEANSTTKQVSDKVDTTLPAGATVIDLMEALSSK